MFKTILLLYLFYTITWAFELTIVHTNDIHGRFETFTSRGAACKGNTTKCYGGVVRRGSYVKQVRDRESNVLLLDAGDQFQGTPWFFTYEGTAASFFLNELNYTAMALGNHEFDLGLAKLSPFLENVTMPILCSNLVINSKVPHYIKENVENHKVFTINGTKVGIIGYITSEVPYLATTEGLVFEEEQNIIRNVAKNLTEKGIKIIIALGHSGLDKDKRMAAKIPQVDVFVGGHGHSFLYNGIPPTKEVVLGSYPVEVPRQNSTGLVVHAGAYGKYVGTLKVTFDENGIVSSWSGNPVLMNSSIPDDKDLQEKVDILNVKVKELYGEVMGSTDMHFDTENNICRAKECEMGNMYADAMIDYEEEADLAIVNSGTFKASLEKGDVTFGDATTVFPFKSHIIFVKLLGSYLRQAFEHSVEDFSLKSKNGKFLQVSRVFVKYDLTRPNGDRVVDLQVYNKKSKLYDKISNDREYKIMVPSWIASGGYGFDVLEKHKTLIRAMDGHDVDIFLAYLKKYSPIKAKLEGRINGMTTFPGWSKTYKEVQWNTKKSSNNNYSCRYRATFVTFIASIFATLVS